MSEHIQRILDESATIEQHREADALWRSIRFQPVGESYLVVLSLVTDRDRLARQLEQAEEDGEERARRLRARCRRLRGRISAACVAPTWREALGELRS